MNRRDLEKSMTDVVEEHARIASADIYGGKEKSWNPLHFDQDIKRVPALARLKIDQFIGRLNDEQKNTISVKAKQYAAVFLYQVLMEIRADPGLAKQEIVSTLGISDFDQTLKSVESVLSSKVKDI